MGGGGCLQAAAVGGEVVCRLLTWPLMGIGAVLQASVLRRGKEGKRVRQRKGTPGNNGLPSIPQLVDLFSFCSCKSCVLLYLEP